MRDLVVEVVESVEFVLQRETRLREGTHDGVCLCVVHLSVFKGALALVVRVCVSQRERERERERERVCVCVPASIKTWQVESVCVCLCVCQPASRHGRYSRARSKAQAKLCQQIPARLLGWHSRDWRHMHRW